MKAICEKIGALVLILVTSSISAQAAVTLLSDDFSTDTMAVDARIRLDSQTWVRNTSSSWAISGGTLNNTATGAGVAAEGATGQTFLVGAGNPVFNQVTVSFDYDVGLDSHLYFNLIAGFQNGSPGASDNFHNTGTTNGSIQDNIDNNFADWNLVSLLDGHGGANQAQEFAAGTSGTYQQTFNLYTHDTGESHTFSTLADYSVFTLSFIRNDQGVAGTGVVIDNFSFTATSAPEPSSLALLLVGGLMLSRSQNKRKLSNS